MLEFLLVNHPLDCPVCDKGGECPLQDQTLALRPGREPLRRGEAPLREADRRSAELVLLDRERCIQCGRCTRFAGEVAGEAQIDFAGRGDAIEVASFPDHVVHVVLQRATPCRSARWARSRRRRTASRPGRGTSTRSSRRARRARSAAASRCSRPPNRVTRLLGVDCDPVNQGWLCDKGRFAFEAVNAENRLAEPLVRARHGANAGVDELVPVSWGEALAAVAERLAAIRPSRAPRPSG